MANVYVRSGAAGANNGTSKTDAYTSLDAAFTASAAGDVFWVATDHAETGTGTRTFTPPGTVSNWSYVYCVSFAGSTPPVAADISTGATIGVTGASGYIHLDGGYCYFNGITFNAGSSTSSARLIMCRAAGHHVYENCAGNLTTTSTSSYIEIGSGVGGGYRIDLINTTFGFYSTQQGLQILNARVNWRDSTGLATGGSFVIPATLIKAGTRASDVVIEAVDLSAAGSGKVLVGNGITDAMRVHLKDCKLDAAVTVADAPAAQGATDVLVTRSDSGATSYRAERHSYAGVQTTDTTIIRTGGSSDGVTGVSWKLATSAGANFVAPMEMLPVMRFNSTTGSAQTLTIEGVWNAAALPTDGEIWTEVECLGTSGSPLGVVSSDAKATPLTTAANQTASTAAWDSLVTARANTTAYTLGQTIKLASNPGRVFFCTTAGTSNGSEPAGYATAVDGDIVSDGTAAFRAGVRFKMAASFTAQLTGAVFAYVKAAKASSTFWIDPKATVA